MDMTQNPHHPKNQTWKQGHNRAAGSTPESISKLAKHAAAESLLKKNTETGNECCVLGCMLPDESFRANGVDGNFDNELNIWCMFKSPVTGSKQRNMDLSSY
jgi:hypothetical protein